MKTPWSYVEYDNRVYVLDADGRRMTEIVPGQRHGQMVTQAERVAIAGIIADSVNLALEMIAARKRDAAS